MRCRFCGGSLQLIEEAPRYIVRYCGKCDIYQTEPQGYSRSVFNISAYDEAWHTMARLSERRVLRSRTRLLKSLPINLRGKRLLEIGPGTGELLKAAATLGCDVLGVDMNRANVEYIRSRWGLPVLNGKFEETEFDQPFDIVVMCDVIEHIEDPRTVLASIKNVLVPEGLLHLDTPNPANLFSLKSGYLVASSFGPDHVTLFTPKSLRTMLEGCGFGLLQLTTYMESTHLASALIGAMIKGSKRLLGKTHFKADIHVTRGELALGEGSTSCIAQELVATKHSTTIYWVKLAVWALRLALGYALTPIWLCPERFLGPRGYLAHIRAVAQA